MNTLTISTPTRGGPTGRLRLAGILAGLALMLTLALGASRADAQPGAQLAAPFPALTLTYTDAQGPGTATFTPQGVDPATGGTAIAVTLTQNGTTFTGNGFARQVEARRYVIAFTVVSQWGNAYYLAGTLNHDNDAVRWMGAGRYWLIGNPWVSDEWRMAGGPYASPPSRPTLSATVHLQPLVGSRVSGTVFLTALPEGATRFSLQFTGLAPGGTYTAQLHTGTRTLLSASFTNLATVTADAGGRATATGLVRYRGTEDIPLVELGDGNHVITITRSGRTVATGSIPVVQPLG